MNEQKRDGYYRKLVANARAIISYQVGLPVGCMKMERILYWIGYECGEAPDFTVFKNYFAEARDLPLSSERLNYSREALRRDDARLVAINLKYREEVIDACFEIIERYGGGKSG